MNFQNEKMKEQIKRLKVDLMEHKEVEKELGKRSHFCNRVIQKYKQQIKLVKEEIEERKKANDSSSIRTGDIARSRAGNNKSNFSNYRSDLTQFLDKRIKDYEAK